MSCGNSMAAKAAGYSSAEAFCQAQLAFDPYGYYLTSEAGSGGPSSVDAKPAWQRQIFNAAKDQSRDLPDVSLFAGSYHGVTWAVICSSYYPCSPEFNQDTTLFEGGIEDRTRLLGALDDINRRFGRFTAAPEGFKREWKMRAESRSHSALPHPRRWRQTCRSSRARNG